MKVTINTKKPRDYEESYLKKESDEDMQLQSDMLTAVSGYVALKIKQICGDDRMNQYRLAINTHKAVLSLLDSINSAEKQYIQIAQCKDIYFVQKLVVYP